MLLIEKNLKEYDSIIHITDMVYGILNCCVNMWYGMAMGITDVPPDVTNIFQSMAFCTELPYFVPALISTLLIDLVIGFFIYLFVTPLINKVTNRMCGI